MSEDNVWGLIPVKDWVWNLYKVTYHRTEDSPAEPGFDRYIVNTDTHIQGEVCEGDSWPNAQLTYAKWEPIVEKVRSPRSVGHYYGHPLYESGWEAGRREAEQRGLK